MLLIQPVALLRKIYPRAVWHLSRRDKTIYLTFDDGPIPELTEWVLDVLKEFNASATFFCVGSNILKHPAVFARIHAEGHTAANHTMYHTKGLKVKTAAYMEEVEACAQLTQNKLFRPPYGRMRQAQYKALLRKGYNVIMWDVISYDYEKINPEKCLHNVLKHARNGSIVLFHDNLKANANIRYALPLFLRHYAEKGFQFKALPV